MMNKSGKSRIASFAKKYEDFFIEMVEGEIAEISCRKNLDTDLEAYKEILCENQFRHQSLCLFWSYLGGCNQKTSYGLN